MMIVSGICLVNKVCAGKVIALQILLLMWYDRSVSSRDQEADKRRSGRKDAQTVQAVCGRRAGNEDA